MHPIEALMQGIEPKGQIFHIIELLLIRININGAGHVEVVA